MANLFSDGFESGNLTAWSASTTDSGDLSADAGAALHGSYGLSTLIDDNNNIYVQDNTPNSETAYRCRFYIDPNSLTMANADEFIIFRALNAVPASVFFIKLQYFTASGYKLFIFQRNDSWGSTNYGVNITDAPHYVEVYWTRATAAGANNGTFSAWVDGVSAGAAVTNIDNDTLEVSTVRLGAELEIDTGTRGTLYFDDFASNNDGSAIGAYVEASSGVVSGYMTPNTSFWGT